MEHRDGKVLGFSHGAAFLSGFFVVIVAKILSAAVIKWTGFSM